ncbi:CBS domain-containing protein [Devosia sp. A369]
MSNGAASGCVLTATPIARVVQVVAETGHHHVPVVTPDGHLAGIARQSDVVAAVFRVNRTELALSGLMVIGPEMNKFGIR